MDGTGETCVETGIEEINVKGTYVWVESIRIEDQVLIMYDDFVRIARLKEEWYEDVKDPDVIIKVSKTVNPKPDIFTFLQRLPYNRPTESRIIE